MKNNFNFLTGREEKTIISYENQSVHKDMLPSFLALKLKAKKEAGINLTIASSYRSFERQKKIWNEKVQGIRKVFDDNESEVNLENLSESEKINMITRFSAIPGTSRHHWGTDIDIFDSNELDRCDLQLHPSEYSETGVFSKLESWLSECIENNENCGFFRPYKEDLGGIHPEPWHISFKPLAQEFFQEYTLSTFQKNLKDSDMLLKKVLLEQSELLYERLLLNISID